MVTERGSMGRGCAAVGCGLSWASVETEQGGSTWAGSAHAGSEGKEGRAGLLWEESEGEGVRPGWSRPWARRGEGWLFSFSKLFFLILFQIVFEFI